MSQLYARSLGTSRHCHSILYPDSVANTGTRSSLPTLRSGISLLCFSRSLGPRAGGGLAAVQCSTHHWPWVASHTGSQSRKELGLRRRGCVWLGRQQAGSVTTHQRKGSPGEMSSLLVRYPTLLLQRHLSQNPRH